MNLTSGEVEERERRVSKREGGTGKHSPQEEGARAVLPTTQSGSGRGEGGKDERGAGGAGRGQRSQEEALRLKCFFGVVAFLVL